MTKIALPLSRTACKSRSRIVRLRTSTLIEQSKLLALGMLPGEMVVVRQRFPSYVVQVGHSQIAMDRETASLIEVEPDRD